MASKKFFYWTMTVRYMPPAGVSACPFEEVHFFVTQRKLEKWKEKHKDDAGVAEWGMHEIDIKTCRELIKLSKKKVKHRCDECGR